MNPGETARYETAAVGEESVRAFVPAPLHGAEVKERFLRHLSSAIERRGALDVLRNGVKDMAPGSGSPSSGPRAGSTRRRGGCTRRTSSRSPARSGTAPGTRRASIWSCF